MIYRVLYTRFFKRQPVASALSVLHADVCGVELGERHKKAKVHYEVSGAKETRMDV